MQIIRDKRDLAYKGLIKQFMQRIGRGKYVILIISDHYLKSENCMYELLQIAKHKKFKERIFPLVLESAKIYKPSNQLEYIRYWEKEIEALEKKIKEGRLTKLQSIFKKLNFYQDIRDNIDKLLEILSDINSLSIESHRKTGYRELYDAIDAKYRKDYNIKQIKILSITASPKEEDPLLYEQEQDTLLDAFREFERRDIFLDMPDPVRSTMAEIEDNLKEGRHDILQITAHGAIDETARGVLSLEDEQGIKKEVSGDQLAKLLLGLKKENQVTVSLVILSSCHSARKELHLMPTAKMLHEAGIPAVIGMKEAISHLAAIDFNVGFFYALKERETIEAAFKAGQEAVAAGEIKRLRDIPNWDRLGEEKIPQLLLNKDKLSAADFSAYEIAAPDRPESHQFSGARYLDRGFIGRRDILRKVYKEVEERVGAIVLKGPGGIGKSTITTRVTANLRRQGYDFIVIRGETTPEGILQSISQKASEIGLKEAEQVNAANAEIEQKLAWFLENFLLKEKLLLIFDNFEENQTWEGAFSNQRLKDFLWYFRDCLKGKETLLLFSTRYQIPGFDVIDVPEFSPVECRKLMFNHKSLKRLKERSIKTLLQEIGGNPRALELLDKIALREFGAREFDWPELKELIPELADRIISTENKEDDFTPLFLQKLLLYIDDPQRRLLDRLAIYRDPVPKVAIAAQGKKIRRPGRIKLQELSLIEYDPDSALYYVHRLTARFVLQHMPLEERKQAHLRAADYFENLKDEEGKMYLDAALEACHHLLQAEEWDRAAELTNGMIEHLHTTGYPYLALELLTGISEKKLSEKNRATLYHLLGICHHRFGDYDEAIKQGEKAKETFEKIGDIKGIATSIHQIGRIYQARGDYDAGLQQYERAKEAFDKIGDKKNVSATLHQIGTIYEAKGDYDKALQQYEKSLEIKEKIGDIALVSTSLHQIGMIHHKRGDFDAAMRHYEKSREIFEKIGDIAGVSGSLHSIGMIYQKRGDYDKALQQYEKSREIKEKIGDISGMALSFGQMGNLHLERKNYTEALRYFVQAFAIFAKIGSPNANAAKYNILKVKDKLPAEQFTKILEEFDIPAGIFDKDKDDDDQGKFAEALLKTTRLAVQARDKKPEEKEKARAIIEQFLTEIQALGKFEGIKAYLQMLLAVVDNEDHEKYKDKIPKGLLEVFEKVMEMVDSESKEGE